MKKENIVINFVPREDAIFIEEADSKQKLFRRKIFGMQVNGFVEYIYDNETLSRLRSKMICDIERLTNRTDIDDYIIDRIDPNIYKIILDYEQMKYGFDSEEILAKYLKAMLQEIKHINGENNKEYKIREKEMRKKALESAGIKINYDLKGILFSRIPFGAKLKLLKSAKENDISKFEIISSKMKNNLSNIFNKISSTKKVISKKYYDSPKVFERKYTAMKGTINKFKEKTNNKEYRKKVVNKIAVAGLLSCITLGTVTSVVNANTQIKNVKDNESKEKVQVTYDSNIKENNNTEESDVIYELPVQEEKNIELKNVLIESVEDNVGIGTKVKLTNGSYYADPNGTTKEYDIKKFTDRYGDEFEISRINIITEDGKNVQINVENGKGITYSQINEMYPNCKIIATHLVSNQMQVGWVKMDMVHEILNNIELPEEIKQDIVECKDGMITKSDENDIRDAITNAIKYQSKISEIEK